jgi:hypothetical protein
MSGRISAVGLFRFLGLVALGALTVGAAGCGGGYYTAGSPPSSEATAASSSSSSSSSSSDDTFDQDRDRIRTTVPGWDEGSGATVRFLKESDGKRTSLIFVDTTAPAWSADQGLWVIAAVAKGSNDTVLGHLLIGVSKLEPGVYEGGPSSKDSVMAVLLGEPKWDGKNPETTWSVNDGSWCRVVLRDLGGGKMEGDFQGKLVDNKGNQYMTIESGYLYIKRP